MDQLRNIHGSLLDRIELFPDTLQPPLVLPPRPVAAGPLGGLPAAPEAADPPEDKGVELPPVKEERESEATPVAEPPGTEGDEAEEGEEVKEAKDQAEKLDKKDTEEKEAKETKEQASRTPEVADQRGRSTSKGEPALKSTTKKEKKPKKEKRDKKDKRSRSERKSAEKRKERQTPSRSPPRGGRSRGPVNLQAAPESPEDPPAASSSSHQPRRATPAGRWNPVHRDPQRPPGHWGGQWVVKPSKGKERRRRWSDIYHHGPSDTRKKEREERRR